MYQNKPKGGKNMRGGNSSVGRGGHRGGGYGQQGRNNSMNGNQYGPQLSNKGTFDAAGSNSSSHTNLSEIDGIYKNSQLLHLVTSMIGSLINVQTLDGKVYEGILKAFSPEFDMALVSVVEVLPKTTKNENTLSSEYKSKNFINDVDNILESLKNNKPPANTMIIKLDDSVKVVLANADLDFASSKKMVLTDSEISKTDSNKPQAQIERELVPWNDGDGDHLDTLDTGNNPAGNTGWNANDMLEYNEKKYKISSTFDDSLTGYTIPLEKRDDEEFRASMEKAEAIAREIEGDGDRSRRLALENELDEETRFSAVLSGGKRDHELGPKDSRDDRRDMKNNNQRNDRHNNSNNNGNNSNNARNPRGQGAPRAEMNWRDESRMRDQNRYYQPQHGNNYANYPQKGGNDSRSGSGNYGNQPKYQNSGNNHHQPQQQQQQQQPPQQQQAPQQQQQQPQQQQPYPPPSNAQSQPPSSSQPPVKSYAGAALSSKPPTNQQPASEHQHGMNTQAPPPTAYNDQYDQRGGPRGGPGPKRTPPPSNYNDNENRRPPHRHDSFNKHNNNTNNNQQRSDVPTPVLRPREPSDYPLRKSNTPPNSSKAPNEDRKTPPNERPQQQQPKPAQQPPTLQTMEAHAEEQKAKESKNDVKKEKSPVKNEPEVKGADVTAVPVSAPAEKPNEQNEKPGDASMSSAGDNAGNSSSTLSKLNPNAKSFTPRGLNVGVQHQQVLQPQVQMQQQVPVSYPQYSNQMPPTSPHPQQFIQIPQIQMAQRPLTHMPPYGNPYQNPALLGPAQYAIPAMQHNSLLHVYQPTVAQQMGGGPPPPNVMPGQHVQGPPHMNQQGQAPQQGQGQRFRGKGPQGQGQPQYLPRGAPQNPQGPPPQHVDYQANVHAVNAVTGPPIQMAGPQAYQQPAPGQVVQQQVSHHHPQQMPGVPMPGPPQQFFYGPPRYNLPMQAHHPGAMNMQPQIAYDPSQMSMMLPAMNCDPAAMFNNAAMAAAAAGNAQMAQVQMAQAQQQSQGVPNNGQGHPGQQQHGVPQPGQVPPPQIQAGNPSQGPPPQAY